jgi:phenylpyruvate tautomerase PptA (4-oxalocrotonate tautomerase family)
MRWEPVPGILLFRENTVAFVHQMAPATISNVDGESDHIRVEVLTPVGVLDREKQLAVVKELTEIAGAAGDPSVSQRTWVLITESPEGGWGIGGHANTRPTSRTQPDVNSPARDRARGTPLRGLSSSSRRPREWACPRPTLSGNH